MCKATNRQVLLSEDIFINLWEGILLWWVTLHPSVRWKDMEVGTPFVCESRLARLVYRQEGKVGAWEFCVLERHLRSEFRLKRLEDNQGLFERSWYMQFFVSMTSIVNKSFTGWFCSLDGWVDIFFNFS